MVMNLNDLKREINLEKSGIKMYQLITDLYPICRSTTGNGFRESLRTLQQHVPLETHEVATGTQVFEWTVPREWTIIDAYVRNSRGEKVIDFNDHRINS